MTTRSVNPAFVFVALSVAILLGGCENLIQAFNELEPGTVQAGQGEYDEHIDIIWSEVLDGDGNEREAQEYEVYREEWDTVNAEWDSSTKVEITGTTIVEKTSYTDRGVESGTAYRYSVLAVFSKSEECLLPCDSAEPTEYAEGYAMAASGLMVRPSENSDEGEQSFDDSGSDRWFEFTAQQGWTYTIEISGTASADAQIYQQGNIRIPVSSAANPGTTTFSAEETSVYHIRIPQGSGTLSVSY